LWRQFLLNAAEFEMIRRLLMDTKAISARQNILLFASIFVLAIIVRIVPALAVQWISNDAVEYLDIARNLASGRGLMLSIKAYHFIATPVVHYANYDRPLLFPALVALFWKLWPHAQTAQVLNVLLVALGAGMAAEMARRVYGLRAAWISGVLLAVAPPLVRTSLYAWSEPLAFALVMGSVSYILHENKKGVFMAGVLAGLAFLTRPTMAIYGFVLFAWLARHRRIDRAKSALLFLAGILPSLLILATINFIYHAPLATTAQGFLYRAVDFHDGMYYFPPRMQSSAITLLILHFHDVLLQIFRHVRDYGLHLLFHRDFLSFLCLLIPIVIWKFFTQERSAGGNLIFLLAGGGLLFICLSWPSSDLDRFLQIPSAFFIIRIVGEANGVHPFRRIIRGALYLLAAITFFSYVFTDLRITHDALRVRSNAQWPMMGTFSSNWKNPDSPALFQWIEANTGSDAVIGGNNPWAIAWHTNRPAILIPEFARSTDAQAFFHTYKVDYIIANEKYPSPVRNYESENKKYYKNKIAQIGSYEIYKRRSGASAFKD